MKTHIACETCELAREGCTFAIYTRIIDGEEHRASVPENETFEVEGSGAQHPRQAILLFVLGERGDGTAMPVAPGYGWNVHVDWVTATNISQTYVSDVGLKRIVVEVTLNGRLLTTLTAFRSDTLEQPVLMEVTK